MDCWRPSHTFTESDEYGHPNDDDVEERLKPELARVLGRVVGRRPQQHGPGQVVGDRLLEPHGTAVVVVLFAISTGNAWKKSDKSPVDLREQKVRLKNCLGRGPGTVSSTPNVIAIPHCGVGTDSRRKSSHTKGRTMAIFSRSTMVPLPRFLASFRP